MKSKLEKVLFGIILILGFIVNVNAETKIKEDVNAYSGDIYIIGSSRFDGDVIVTAAFAGRAGARETYIQYVINSNYEYDPSELTVYYYSELDKSWYELPETANDEMRSLSEEETDKLTGNLNIYFVNDTEKLVEVPYNIEIKDGQKLVFSTNNPSMDDDVKFENNKLLIPATVKWVDVFLKNSDQPNMYLESFQQVNTEFVSNTVTVKTLDELKNAIALEKNEIKLGANITGITETIKIPYKVYLNGAGYTLGFKDVAKVNGYASGLVISGDYSSVENLTIEMDGKSGWQGNYGLQVYDAKEVKIYNYTGTNADAALLVNASSVSLYGNIDVTGNESGGIEVSKGTAVGLENSTLTLNGNITMDDEAINRPVMWIEKEEGTIENYEGAYVSNTSVPTSLNKEQTYFYTSESIYTKVEADSADELIVAIAASSVENIVLSSDLEIPTALKINKKLTIDLNGQTLSMPEDEAGDGVFHVVAGGDLTINGDGVVNGIGNNDYNMAIFADGGKVTINGGKYTNVGATANVDPTHFDLIYAKNGAEVIINGGYFENATPKWTLNSHDTLKGTIIVKGGTFAGYNPAVSETENPVANFVAEGYKVVEQDGDYTVVELDGTESVLVNGIVQTNLQDAVTNAQAGSTITLADNIELPTALKINKKLTIDLNGQTLSMPEDEAGDGVFHVVAGGDLTINGDGVVNGIGNNDYNMAIFADGGKVTINGGKYTNVGATANVDPTHFDLIYAKNGAEVIINGGYFENATPKWTLNSHDTLKGTIIVKGGTFAGYNPAESETENPVANFVAEGYKVVEQDGVYTVQKATE